MAGFDFSHVNVKPKEKSKEEKISNQTMDNLKTLKALMDEIEDYRRSIEDDERRIRMLHLESTLLIGIMRVENIALGKE